VFPAATGKNLGGGFERRALPLPWHFRKTKQRAGLLRRARMMKGSVALFF
jgi:hypothetical protein